MIWFARGMAIAVLVMGALNAGSYFIRSERLGDLLGMTPQHREAIGFPFLLWDRDAVHVDPFLGDFAALFASGLVADIGFGILLGLVLGGVLFAYRKRLENRLQELIGSSEARPSRKTSFQFSLRTLLSLMAISAVLAAGVSKLLAGRPEVLGAIYFFGPWALVGMAYIPARVGWRQRVALITPLTLILMSLAVVAGSMMQPPLLLDKTLLGIFVCWTPQTAVVAIVVTIWTFLHEKQQADPTRAPLSVEASPPG